MDEAHLRERLCAAAYQLWLRGLLVGDEGLVTVELHRRRFLALPAGERRADLQPNDLMVVDLGGQELYGDRSLNVRAWHPHRVALHLELEQESGDGPARDEIRATALVNPVHVEAAARSRRVGETLSFGTWSVPIVPAEDEPGLRQALLKSDAVMIEQQGLLVVGRSLDDALNRAEAIEHVAAVQCAAGNDVAVK